MLKESGNGNDGENLGELELMLKNLKDVGGSGGDGNDGGDGEGGGGNYHEGEPKGIPYKCGDTMSFERLINDAGVPNLFKAMSGNNFQSDATEVHWISDMVHGTEMQAVTFVFSRQGQSGTTEYPHVSMMCPVIDRLLPEEQKPNQNRAVLYGKNAKSINHTFGLDTPQVVRVSKSEDDNKLISSDNDVDSAFGDL